MRAALTVGALALLLVATADTAVARTDRDCDDFADQSDAQAFLDRYPDDPNNLDRDRDGVACEQLLLRGAPGQRHPVGGVATGGGGRATYRHSLAVAGAVALVAARVARLGRRA